MKERRNKLGLTQEQVAECACISVRSYKMYEAHQREAVNVRNAIIDILDISEDEIREENEKAEVK